MLLVVVVALIAAVVVDFAAVVSVVAVAACALRHLFARSPQQRTQRVVVLLGVAFRPPSRTLGWLFFLDSHRLD